MIDAPSTLASRGASIDDRTTHHDGPALDHQCATANVGDARLECASGRMESARRDTEDPAVALSRAGNEGDGRESEAATDLHDCACRIHRVGAQQDTFEYANDDSASETERAASLRR